VNKPTTPKQRQFIRQFIRTGNATEAAMRTFDCKKRSTAKVIGCNLLTKLNFTAVELMEKMGLSLEEDIKDLKRLRKAKATKFFAHEGQVIDQKDCDDNATQTKALEISLKLRGALREQVDHSMNININLAEALKEGHTRLENYANLSTKN
jgi:hypothetical protein